MEILHVGSEPQNSGIQEVDQQEARSLRFTYVPGAFEALLEDREVKDALTQYGLDGTLQLSKFRFAGHWDGTGSAESALLDFFNDPVVQSSLANECTGHRQFLGRPSGTIKRINFHKLETSAIDMSLFAKLKNQTSIVSSNGYLRKCMDEIYDGATASNLLMDLFLNEESSNASLFDSSEQNQLLFRLLRWLVVGGSLNQPNETLPPYLDMVKRFCKSLVQVVKEPASGVLKITSQAFLVEELDGSHRGLFPEENQNSICIVVLTPSNRTATILNSAFMPFL